GAITFSSLSTTGIVHNNASGVLSTSPLSLSGGATEISGILPVTNGGTGVNASAAANGSLLIGNGTGFTVNTLTGTANQITVTNGAGTITLSLPQNIAVNSSPTFASETLTNTTNQLVLGTTNTTTIN